MANIPYFDITELLKANKNNVTYEEPVNPTVKSEPVKEVTITKSNRCSHAECKRKLMLTDITCKCEKRYCISHRHPETHSCKFDYKTSGLAHLSTILVKTVGDRLKERI